MRLAGAGGLPKDLPGGIDIINNVTINPGQAFAAIVVAQSDGNGMFSFHLGTTNSSIDAEFLIGSGQWNFQDEDHPFQGPDISGPQPSVFYDGFALGNGALGFLVTLAGGAGVDSVVILCTESGFGF
jgi:hypothetical protein